MIRAKLLATASNTTATSSYAASAFASNSQASDLAAKVKAANDAVISAVAPTTAALASKNLPDASSYAAIAASATRSCKVS